MSLEQYRADAQRWLKQAEADPRAARSSRDACSFEWACFQSQQAGEKALKALWLASARDPWGHSLAMLTQSFPDSEGTPCLAGILDDAKALDKLYIPTRCPNGLPDLTPSEVYTRREADEAIAAAERILVLLSPHVAAKDAGSVP